MNDRRDGLRAPSFRNGMLVVCGERYFVRIDDESTTGFDVAAQYMPGFPIGSIGCLFMDGDQEIDVVVRQMEPAGIHVRIGLERREPPNKPADLRDTFAETQPPTNSNGTSIIVAAIVGLAIGCVFVVEPLRHWLAEFCRRSRFF